MKQLETEAQGMKELEAEEVALVSGASLLAWLTGVLTSGRETSTPANNGAIGIRG
jgi:hypothetical protein